LAASSLYKCCFTTITKRKERTFCCFSGDYAGCEEEISEPAFDELSNETLLASIQELPNGYREILNLFIFEGLKHREIASQLNISEGTSRSQYARAKKLLKSIMEKKTKINTYSYAG